MVRLAWRLLVGALALAMAIGVTAELRRRLRPRNEFALVLTSLDGAASRDAPRLVQRFSNLDAISSVTATAPGRIEMTIRIPLGASPENFFPLLRRAHLAFRLLRDYSRPETLERDEILTNRDVKNARAARDERPYVSLELTEAGAARFAAFTSSHVGDFVAIVLDGQIVTAPKIAGPITGGVVAIHAGPRDTPEQALVFARDVALTLRAGELQGTWTALSVTARSSQSTRR